MKKIIGSSLFLILVSGTALAGEANINWSKFNNWERVVQGRLNDDSFNDRALIERSRETVTKEFTYIFSRLTNDLPDGVKLEIDVLDLALKNNSDSSTELYWPRFNFTYNLKNAKGEILASGSEQLKDMVMRGNVMFQTVYPAEARMIQDWLKSQQVAGNFPTKQERMIVSSN
ncbi:DUF3016 domain-containing protein [Undibacterium fentianense]|uniref:DUF3016 domain-containing protein n=1 Tax=Undibacterium fentianense TaxID=2828728 RepID=A0A941E2X5_9BURK|nr:DUF3016 domain-containing protein [Undibacterium fentianense]MBR7800481.1 DUF3016 domain-containing protein [Undibacterium fentianense]